MSEKRKYRPSNFEPEDEFNPCYHCKSGKNIKFDFTPIKDEEIPEPCKTCEHGFGEQDSLNFDLFQMIWILWLNKEKLIANIINNQQ